MRRQGRVCCLLLVAFACRGSSELPASEVQVLRTPDGGIQPQIVATADVLHLIYYTGAEAHGDVQYVRSQDGGQTFSPPLRVNQVAGSAIAVGNIRGAHLAVGRNGRPHVAWMGSDQAAVSGPNGATPMLYTRLRDDGRGFETERNLIQFAAGLDGGGSVAADGAGNVYVAWHAAKPGGRTEQDRTVWIAHSRDDGQTFAAERPAWKEPAGACGCCGMRIFADSSSNLHVLYRGAERRDQRDMYLLFSRDQGQSFRGRRLQPWPIEACPMSSAAFVEGKAGVVAAWETADDVYAALIPRNGGEPQLLRPAGQGKKRKHPAVALNDRGELLLAWVEDMSWKTPGRLKWTLFDEHGAETAAPQADLEVPTWGVVAVAVKASGDFLVVH